MHFIKAVILFAGIAAAVPASSSKPASAAPSKSPSATPSKAPSATPSKAPSSTPIIAAAISSTAAATSSKALSTTPFKSPSATPSKVASATPSKAPSSTPVIAAAISSTPAAIPPPSASQIALLSADFKAFDFALDAAVAALTNFTGGTQIANQAQAVSQAGQTWQKATLQLLDDAELLASYGVMAASDSAALASLITGDITEDLVEIYQLLVSKKALFAQVGSVQSVHDGLVVLEEELGQIGQAIEPHFHPNDITNIHNAGTTIFNSAQDAINAFSS